MRSQAGRHTRATTRPPPGRRRQPEAGNPRILNCEYERRFDTTCRGRESGEDTRPGLRFLGSGQLLPLTMFYSYYKERWATRPPFFICRALCCFDSGLLLSFRCLRCILCAAGGRRGARSAGGRGSARSAGGRRGARGGAGSAGGARGACGLRGVDVYRCWPKTHRYILSPLGRKSPFQHD